MKRLVLAVIVGVTATAMIFTSCKKKEELDFDTASTIDNSTAESNFDQVFKQVDQAAVSKSLGKAGPVITIDSLSSPKRMTIDYGASTLCDDNKVRSGQIIVTWTGKYRDPGTVITVTFLNFVQNGHQFDNSSVKTITNNGKNPLGLMTWHITANAKVTLSSGEVITWMSDRTRTWIAGDNTPGVWQDDRYEVVGTSNGVNRKGVAYTCNITTPLLVDLSCNLRRITKGVIELTPEGKATRTINFGDGACDAEVEVTVNGRVFKIGKY